ncbi:MAG: ribose 5-phosphate isomerase B [Firmicutes bacterium]|nr:ribose 5-phosphate isomerase B [Bacillota bacterium]
MHIAIGSDHAGFQLKERVKEYLVSRQVEFTDFGVENPEPVDYPDIARVVAEAVASGACDQGILICGTGIGMTIAANKVPGIRAALCQDPFTARAAREHNDANILALGERVLGPGLACEIVEAWLQARFAGGRHARRLAKIRLLEEKYCCGEGLQHHHLPRGER